jgi:hypothetical protein
MTEIATPLDKILQETLHQRGGFEFIGDPALAMELQAEPFFQYFEVSAHGKQTLVPGGSVASQIQIWRDSNLVADSRKLLSLALPPRHTLWWALMSLVEAHRQKPYSPEVLQVIKQVRDFVLKPSERSRRLCREWSKKAGSATAGRILGSAAFLAGGSMGPADCPPMFPKPHLCGRLCGAVIYLASVRFNPTQYKLHLQHFLQIGLDIAYGRLPIPMLKEIPKEIIHPSAGWDASELIPKDMVSEQVHAASGTPQTFVPLQ